MIDLRSDTVTLPCNAMRAVMADAPVGDDVYGEDPTVNNLEAYAAELLAKPSALFVPSGTQSNLLALLTHCQRGEEYIVGQDAHTYRYEGGGAAVLGGIQPQPLPFTSEGTIPIPEIQANIKPDDFHFARTKLVCLENTQGGKALNLSYIQDVASLCSEHKLSLHLDGARFFNACIAEDVEPAELAYPFDSISICLSKGLGAPVGSILVGSASLIRQARRWRKMLGGGMRQAGIVAAAGMYALQHNRARLAIDHQHAELVAQTLMEKFGQEGGLEDNVVDQATNMLHLNLSPQRYAALRDHLIEAGIRANRPRWVFHLDISEDDVGHIVDSIQSF